MLPSRSLARSCCAMRCQQPAQRRRGLCSIERTNAKGTLRTVSNVISKVIYELDANGNLTSDGLRTFQYGADNRLAEVDVSDNGEAAKVTYLHNAIGQRTFKSEPQTAQTLPNQAVLGDTFIDWLKKNFGWLYATAQNNATIGTAYSYADGNLPSWALLGEYGNGGATSSGRVEYIWLPTEDGNVIPVAMFRSNRYYSIHTDHLGTPRLIKDDEAKPVWQWSYSAFGDNKPTGILKATTNPNSAVTNTPALLAASSPAFAFNLRFPGQYADSETGLFYNYYRSYQATQGRYTQGDPIGLAGGMNRFGYVNQNPLRSIDPRGLTQADIDSALAAAKAMMPGWKFPDAVKTWSQNGKGGKSNFWSNDVFVDSKYLECLDDSDASGLLNALLHELGHFNQTWYQFGFDNIRERVTGGSSSAAQDTADALLFKNYAVVAQYLKNRTTGKNTCGCRK